MLLLDTYSEMVLPGGKSNALQSGFILLLAASGASENSHANLGQGLRLRPYLQESYDRDDLLAQPSHIDQLIRGISQPEYLLRQEEGQVKLNLHGKVIPDYWSAEHIFLENAVLGTGKIYERLIAAKACSYHVRPMYCNGTLPKYGRSH